MLAITLAAGKGRRIGLERPKATIEFQGGTLLSKQVKLFKKLSIPHYVVGGYKCKLLDFDPACLMFNERFAETNMVYTFLCARELLENSIDKQDIIVSYGDILYQEDVLQKLINSEAGDLQICADKNFLAYWSLRMVEPLEDLESFLVSNDGYITDIGSKNCKPSDIQAQYIGLFKISNGYIRDFLRSYDELHCRDHILAESIAMTNFINTLISKGCKAVPIYISGGWLEFDTAGDIEVYNKLETQKIIKDFYDGSR